MHYEHWSQVPRTYAAWPFKYFGPQEIACRGSGRLLVVPDFLDRLDRLRSRYGRPLRVLSAYRSPAHNALVGGAPLSRHKGADACDLSIVGEDKAVIDRLAHDVGFRGFGYYNTFIHVDMGRPRSWGSWRA